MIYNFARGLRLSNRLGQPAGNCHQAATPAPESAGAAEDQWLEIGAAKFSEGALIVRDADGGLHISDVKEIGPGDIVRGSTDLTVAWAAEDSIRR